MLKAAVSKSLLYFQPTETYWQKTNKTPSIRLGEGSPGYYPLKMRIHYHRGHFPAFDETGIPLYPAPDGSGYTYYITTMASYALGIWEVMLSDDCEERPSADDFITVANKILQCSRQESCGRAFRNVNYRTGRVGNLSAMSLGMSASVMLRAWCLTQDMVYQQAAYEILGFFEREIDEGGVVGRVGKEKLPWYEEYPVAPFNHVLNGKIFSLWGLEELWRFCGSEQARDLYWQGLASIAAVIDRFDTGYWSYYWIPGQGASDYVASMMYHNLHIVQLGILGECESNSVLLDASKRFKRYASKPLNRVKAVSAIALSKARLK
ncbi:hypothetical protein JXA80_12060 [bacterium]|nr:hypothetical protein [candidate division CSSED10-310 bacterium]